MQVTIVELSITSPRMTTSPDFSLPFDDYGITREEIAVVVNNLEGGFQGTDVPRRLVLLEPHKTALFRAKR